MSDKKGTTFVEINESGDVTHPTYMYRFTVSLDRDDIDAVIDKLNDYAIHGVAKMEVEEEGVDD